MKRISIGLAAILCVILLIGPFGMLKSAVFPKTYTKQQNRVHLNTANTTRIIASTPDKMSMEISKILYPNENPKSVILLQSYKWQDVLTVMPIVQKYKSTIININDNLPFDVQKYISKLNLKGIKELDGTQILVIGREIGNLKEQLKNVNLKCTYIKYNTTEQLQEVIYNTSGIRDQNSYGFLVKDNDPLASIPAATWIANQGGVILYANKDNILYDSSREILKMGTIKNVYILADESLDGDAILKPFKVKGHRITAYSSEASAVKFSKFHDKENFIGWGSDRKRDDEGHNYILCSKKEPVLAAIAAQLSTKGRTGPILWTDSDKLSAITENYLWRMKPNYWVNANEGPYNSVWIVGDNNIINYGVQSRVDYTQGVTSYKMMGKEGVSGIESVAIVWMLISVLGSLWTTMHIFSRMRYLSLLTKIMWILTVLVLGPIGIWIYVISYVNSPWMKANGKILCMRPVWKQVLVADVMGLSFGGSSIIGVQYIMMLIGLPLGIVPEKSGMYLIGNPEIILMVVSYIMVFILNRYCFVPTMFIEMKDISYIHAKKEAVVPVVVSISSIFIGIAFSMWWLSRVYVPRIPEEDYILWWGFMNLSVLIGGVIAYIPNWILVKYGKKSGTI